MNSRSAATGASLAKLYGWASPAFGDRVTFADMSRSGGNDDWTLAFSSASHHVHAPHSGTLKSAAADAVVVFV
jgi:hypothetical protein